MHVLSGFGIGLMTLFVVGPVVFVLINATINNGLKSGMSVAFGIFISDLIYAVFSLKSVDTLINISFLDRYLSIIGFVILFSFGIVYLLKKENTALKVASNKTHIQNFIQGFSINFFNPFVFSFWILLAKRSVNAYNVKALEFLLALVFGVLVIDLAKVFLAKKLNPLINSNRIIRFYKVSGIVMILFSLQILYYLFRDKMW